MLVLDIPQVDSQYVHDMLLLLSLTDAMIELKLKVFLRPHFGP